MLSAQSPEGFLHRHDAISGVQGGMGLPADEAHPPKHLPIQDEQHPLGEAQERRVRAQREQER